MKYHSIWRIFFLAIQWWPLKVKVSQDTSYTNSRQLYPYFSYEVSCSFSNHVQVKAFFIVCLLSYQFELQDLILCFLLSIRRSFRIKAIIACSLLSSLSKEINCYRSWVWTETWYYDTLSSFFTVPKCILFHAAFSLRCDTLAFYRMFVFAYINEI